VVVNLDYMIFYPAGIASAGLALAAVCNGNSWHPRKLLAVSLLFGAVYLARNLLYAPQLKEWGTDFRIYWEGGRCFWNGKDPYTSIRGIRPPNDGVNIFNYPPHSIPVFALFSRGSQWASAYLWTVTNTVLCLGIGLLGRQVLVLQDEHRYPVVSPGLAILLSTPVLLSRGVSFGLENGQAAILTTMSLLVALSAQACRPQRSTTAALALALASIKIATSLPFFALFCRKSDVGIWVRFTFIAGALILISGNPATLPERVTNMFANVAKLREPTYMNDYSPRNPSSNSIVSIEGTISRLGVADRAVVDRVAKITLVGLGLVVLYVVLGRSDIDRGASCSIVSFYSMLFLYHRIYDFPILILPLLYAASRFSTDRGYTRWCYLWIMVAVLLAINTPIALIRHVIRLSDQWAVLKALIVPIPFYLVASGLIAQLIAIGLRRRELTIADSLSVVIDAPAAHG
jgi:hypothetical protein